MLNNITEMQPDVKNSIEQSMRFLNSKLQEKKKREGDLYRVKIHIHTHISTIAIRRLWILIQIN